MAGTPLKRARRAEREADQLATFESVKRPALPEPHQTPAAFSLDLIPELLALASDGYAPAEIAAHWMVSEEDVAEWGKTCPDFQAALNHARAREKAWWLSRARLAIRDDNNRFPAGAWSHVMRSRFPDFDDKAGLGALLDLGALVIIQRRAPEPLGERAAPGSMPLIEGRSVRLEHGPTVQGSGETTLSDAPGSAVAPD